eukprot:scaffold7241_cov356-Prasinococcus_capsulatus_cf.AAC.2
MIDGCSGGSSVERQEVERGGRGGAGAKRKRVSPHTCKAPMYKRMGGHEEGWHDKVGMDGGSGRGRTEHAQASG